MAAAKKNAARLGAHLVFVDETGFLLIPPVRRTWAPKGQTPILRHRYLHNRISVIGGITVSPKLRHIGLYYRLHNKNIQQDEVYDFIWYLMRHLRGRVIILWDNASIHSGGVIHELCLRYPRLRVEYFPSYAPDLNPAEGVWQQSKTDLANGRPDNIWKLGYSLIQSLVRMKGIQKKLRACIRQSALPSFLP